MAYTTIKKPSSYFNTKLYTGNGGTLNVTGVGFQPDLVWQKSRSLAYNHNLYDVIRGANAHLRSNLITAEASPTDGLTSFDSDGYTMVQGGAVEASNNGATYATWNWLANGAGSANTDGSISSTVSANTTSGFSIVSYTGTGANATVGHGLSSVPKMVIVRRRDGVGGWETYHSSVGATKYIELNSTDATATNSTLWQDTAPTSSVFSIGTNGSVNNSGGTFIAYCFAEKQGFSKFGSYTGNGNVDGTFIYTGFKPAWFMCKKTDSVNSWVMFDNKRSSSGGSNEIDFSLTANSSDAEETGTTSSDVDFCANGIKIREDNGGVNASGGSYIYMAFAEEPLVGDNPATAR